MKRVYRVLLRLYPQPYCRMYGSEMAGVFKEALDACGAAGFFILAALLWREFSGIFVAAFQMRAVTYVTRTRPFARFLALGAAVTAFGQSVLFSNCGIGRHLSIPADVAQTQMSSGDIAVVLQLIGASLILIFVLTTTFVWNLRNIGRRRV